jgi:S1-C subfamily serine protease
MRTPTLASLSLLATGIACGASLSHLWPAAGPAALVARSDAQATQTTIPPASEDPEESLRITPVVRAVRRAADSVISIYLVDSVSRTAEGQGSGVILDESGLVITNWHVVWQALQSNRFLLEARLKDNRQFLLRILSTARDDDLALLQLELPPGEHVQPIALGDSSTLMIGETAIAIGNPQGNSNSVTCGVLSAEDRNISARAPDGGVLSFTGLLQTDAAINPGNSGGALLDITGKLIGINNAMAANAENIGFAIPVNTIKQVFHDKLLSSENLANVWLGMRVEDREGHVVVTGVEPQSPAARAGVRPGDQVLAAGGQEVRSGIDYARRMLQAQPGESFPLRLQRDGRAVSANPVPLAQQAFELVRRLGLEAETVSGRDDPELVRGASLAFYGNQRRVPLLPGVVRVTRVYPDSPASDLQVQEGDVLLGFAFRDWWGGYREAPFVSVEDLANKLRDLAGQTVQMIVLRDGKVLDGRMHVRG